jgi:hypothetical protein
MDSVSRFSFRSLTSLCENPKTASSRARLTLAAEQNQTDMSRDREGVGRWGFRECQVQTRPQSIRWVRTW